MSIPLRTIGFSRNPVSVETNGATVTLTERTAEPPALSFHQAVATYVPADEYECVTFGPLPADPSPNVQFTVPGPAPPVRAAENATVPPAVGIAGEVEMAVIVGIGTTEMFVDPLP
jgi:hypothetical protein